MARTHTQINAQKNTHAQMPPFPRHQTQHASAPRIRVCVRSMANKQLLDTQVSLQPNGGPKQLFVRDEHQPIVISQSQESVYLRQGTKTPLDTSSCDSSAGSWAALSFGCSYTGKNIHMFCINAWVASSSFCFVFFSLTRCLSGVLFMWLTLRNDFWE